MSSGSLSALQVDIIRRCEEHETLEKPKYYYNRCIVLGEYFVKYNSHGTLFPEYSMQQYIYNQSEVDASAPRVPKVYDYFTPENKMAYLVMEYIKLNIAPARDAPEKVAEALQWLRRVSPSDATIGSLDPSAGFTLFHGLDVSLKFSGIEALERYINRALDWSRPGTRPEDTTISFSNEKLVFTQPDMDESNFFLDTEGKLCLIDFQEVSLLPESFAAYAVWKRDPFVKKVAECLNWPTHNVKSMGSARGFLMTMSDITLGLDEDGLPKARASVATSIYEQMEGRSEPHWDHTSMSLYSA